MKKSNKIIAVCVLVVVLILTIVPSLLKKKVSTLIVQDIETSSNLQVKYEALRVSFFKSFPHIKVDVNAFQLESPTETLFFVQNINAELSLSRILKNELKITSAVLLKPRLNYSYANDDTTLTSSKIVHVDEHLSPASKSSLFSFDIESFTVSGGEILYAGQDSLFLTLKGVDLQLSGSVDADEVLLKTLLTVSAIDYKTQGFSMKSIPLNFDAQMHYGLDSRVLQLEDNILKLGGFTTTLVGKVNTSKTPDFDLAFEATKTDVKHVLALLPVNLIKDINDIEAKGDVNLKGFVRGEYRNVNELPAFGVDFTIADAWFKYNNLPSKVEAINMKAKVSHPANTRADSTLIAIEYLEMRSGDNNLQATLNITKPATDVTVSGKMKSIIDFASLKDAIPMQSSELVGQLDANILFDGRLADIAEENYKDFDASGQLSLHKYFIKNSKIPQGLSVAHATMQFTPERINIRAFSGSIGTSDLKVKGYLSNYFAYIFDDKTLNGNLNVTSQSLNLNEFSQGKPSKSRSVSSSTNMNERKPFIVPKDLNIILNSSISKVKVDNLYLSNFKGRISINQSKLLLDNLTFSTLSGSVKANGEYNTQNSKSVYSDMSLKINNVDLSEAAKSISVLSKMMPITQTTQGRVSSEMKYFAKLDAKGDVDLKSIKSEGFITSPGLRIANNKSLDDLAKQLKDPRYKDITTSAIHIDYKMNKGVITLDPFDVKMVDKNVNAGGWYSIDNKMNFRIKTTVKAKEIGGDVSKYIGMVSDVNKPLPVTIILSGDASKPNVKYDTREAIKVLRDDVTKNLNKDAINSILKGFF